MGLVLYDEGRRHMALWAAQNPRGAHGFHEYAPEDFGLDPLATRRRYSFYMERFGIGS